MTDRVFLLAVVKMELLMLYGKSYKEVGTKQLFLYKKLLAIKRFTFYVN